VARSGFGEAPVDRAPTIKDGVSVLLGIGSNLGDRRRNIERSVEILSSEDRIRVLRVSRLLETEPVGGPPQGPYLNGAAEVLTALDPHALLQVLHRVEAALGRVRRVRCGPRQIDLDILLFGDLVLKDADLEIPHPRMLERRFVLDPLVEIAPDRLHPITKLSLREHRESLLWKGEAT